MFTHGLPGAGRGRARSHHSWVPAPHGDRRAQRNSADSGIGGRRGPCPATPPTPATARSDRAKVGQVLAAGPAVPGPQAGARPSRSGEAAAARPEGTAVETRSLGGSSATEAGDAGEQLAPGDSVSPSPTEADNTGSPRPGARAGAAKPAPGRAPSSPAALGPALSPKTPAPGRPHLPAPPTTAGRPASTALTSAAHPRKRSSAPAHQAVPLPPARPESGPAGGGAEGGAAARADPKEGHAHQRPRPVGAPRGRRPDWSQDLQVSASRRLSVAVRPWEPDVCRCWGPGCGPHPVSRLETLAFQVLGLQFAVHIALVPVTAHT